MAFQRKTAVAQTEGPNFGDLAFYTAGGGLPEGNYALLFDLTMYQAQTQQGVIKGPPRLGVMLTAHSLTDLAAAPQTQFYSMGSQADKSFAPNPKTGKGLVAVPGGPGTSLNNSTNWAVFLQHLYDCGLPRGIFSNDLTVLDGVHVHMASVPEPEERKGFRSQTGEAGADDRRPGTISVPTEILPDGAPWEGGGGIPEAEAQPAKSAPKAPARAVAGKLVAEAQRVEQPSEDDSMVAALNGASAVLENKPAGVSKLLLRTGMFKAITEAAGGDMAQAVISTYFSSDDALNGVLGQLGYAVVGSLVKPA